MFDIWGFLLQTLTASGVAALLLVIKALFKDKLPPKWHFAVWGVLGIMMLIPTGLIGRYTLFNWQLIVGIIKSWFGDYSYTQVLFPIPVLTSEPATVIQWIFVGYILGIVIHIIKYITSYIRLCLVLRKGSKPDGEIINHIQQIADNQKVKVCRVITVPSLPSAFVCGIIRPVLAIPKNTNIDDKIILHELLHLKYKDTLWNTVICLFRCIHWCNPFLIYCANRAINDMEARCDQHVLEQLKGEERRDYGRILLSMANDRFAKTPASTCINNGGKNIRERIEAIARFKKYPAGMGLVSVCAIILLTLSLVVGVQASKVYDSSNSIRFALASARSTPCTTLAGAFDTYGKAILEQNGIYRAMCAPEAMQADILNEMIEKDNTTYPNWDCGLDEWPDEQSGYYIYNLKQCDKNTYEGLLVVKVNYPPNGQPAEDGKIYLAVQNLRVEKENGRWVAIPLDEFRNVEASDQSLRWGCMELPGIVYSGTCNDIRIDVKIQNVYTVENTVQTQSNNFLLGNSTSYDTTPKPDAEFTFAASTNSSGLTHTGSAQDRDKIEQVGLSAAPVYPGEDRPDSLPIATGHSSGGSSSTGEHWSTQKTDPGWGPTLEFGGGGGSIDPENYDVMLPEYYAADLYVNNKLAAQLDLHLKEEVTE